MCDPVSLAVKGFEILAGAAPVVSSYSGVKQADVAEEAAHTQKMDIKKEQQTQKKEIATQQAKTLKKRKTRIDLMKRQLPGKGDSLGQTGATGVTSLPADTATEEVLG